MIHYKNTQKNIIQIIQVMGINAIIFGVLMLFFESTAKNDDLHMSLYLTGAFDGRQGFSIWMHPIFDYIVRFFISITNYPYMLLIIEYICVYISFCVIYNVMINSFRSKYLLWISTGVLFLAGYEFYVRLTFTKTAGIVGIAGYILLFYAIEMKKKIPYFFGGFGLIFLSVIIRGQIMLMLTLIFSSVFVIVLFDEGKEGVTSKNFRHKICKYVICALLVVFVQQGLEISKDYILRNSDWAVTYEANAGRANLYDYGWPEYSEYEEQYQQAGISKNDYKIWHDYHILSDSNVLSSEKLFEMATFDQEESAKGNLWLLAGRKLLDYLLLEPMFWFSLIAGVVALICAGNIVRCIGELSVIYGSALLAYLYLFMRGRTMHHVDVVIFFAVLCLIVVKIIANNTFEGKNKYHLNVILLMWGACTVGVFYNWIGGYLVGDSSYARVFLTDVEGQKKDYEAFKLMSDDDKHLYAYIYQDFIYEHVFPVKKSFFHNLYETNYTVGNVAHINQLNKYNVDGVEDFWKEMLNSKSIYFRVTEDTKDRIPYIEKYMQEHYAENTKAYLVKQIGSSYVYCFRDRDIDLTNETFVEGTDSIQFSVKYDQNGDGGLIVEGTMYKSGESSYNENIYVELVDNTNGERKYYIATKKENNDNLVLKDKTGKYGNFKCEIEELPREMNNYEINVILEGKNCFYRRNIADNIGK